MAVPHPAGPATLPWAKSDRSSGQSLPLWRHMADSAAVAGLLWDEWLPRGIVRRLSADLDDEAQARRRLLWLAATHDLGKATAAFQIQVPELCEGMRDAGFDFRVLPSERAQLPHSLASMYLLGRWLEKRHGWDQKIARSYAVVPGSHHGVTPTNGELLDVSARPALIGETEAWHLAQDGLADFAEAVAGVTPAGLFHIRASSPGMTPPSSNNATGDKWLRSLPAMQSFITQFPGESGLPAGTPVGFPAWLAWQHGLNEFIMLFIIRSGWQVRTIARPDAYWTRNNKGMIRTKGSPVRISLNLWLHLSLDTLWIIKGVVFYVLLFVTGQWARLVPVHWDIFPNAISADIQYASLNWPAENGWSNYNGLQTLTYFLVAFIAVRSPDSRLRDRRAEQPQPHVRG